MEQYAYQCKTNLINPDRKLGSGGMGAVYETEIAGDPLAVKVQQISSKPLEGIPGVCPVWVNYKGKGVIHYFPDRRAGENRRIRQLGYDDRVSLQFAIGERQNLRQGLDCLVGFVDQSFVLVDGYLCSVTYMESLRDWTRLDAVVCNGTSAQERYGLIARLGEALAECSDAGLVHRDLKPENVMVSPERKVKLIDWGTGTMEKYSHHPGDDQDVRVLLSERLLRPQVFVGTIGYTPMDEVVFGKPTKHMDKFSYGMVSAFILGEDPLREGINPLHYTAGRRESILYGLRRQGEPEELVEALGRAIEVSPPREYEPLMEVARKLAEQGEDSLEVRATTPVPGRPTLQARPKTAIDHISRATTILVSHETIEMSFP